MRDGEVFRRTIRRGSKSVTATLIVHGRSAEPPQDWSVGLVVAKPVGSAVVRNRVKRRLRHLMRSRIDDARMPATVVIRARPAAATASSATLAKDLDSGLAKALNAR